MALNEENPSAPLPGWPASWRYCAFAHACMLCVINRGGLAYARRSPWPASVTVGCRPVGISGRRGGTIEMPGSGKRSVFLSIL